MLVICKHLTLERQGSPAKLLPWPTYSFLWKLENKQTLVLSQGVNTHIHKLQIYAWIYTHRNTAVFLEKGNT